VFLAKLSFGICFLIALDASQNSFGEIKMYLYTSKGREILRQRGLSHDMFPVMLIGAGPDSFIGPTAWIPNLMASRCFKIEYVSPSRNEENTTEFLLDYGLLEESVSKDYQALLKSALEECEETLVVCICTETPHHAEQIKFCINEGVKQIIMDKPPVVNLEEWQEVMDLADEHNCLLLVSYQHTMNSPTAEIASRVKSFLLKGGDPKDIELTARFLQDWLYQPPSLEECRQVWRLEEKWCGLLDIGTHVADGASVLAGSPISKVLSSQHSKARKGQLDKPALDNGKMEVMFQNGIHGSIDYHQALPGHADDIYWLVRLNNKDGLQESLMWRMEDGCDTLWISKVKDANPDDKSFWVKHLRAHSSEFSEASNKAFSINPAGHIQGWSDMWRISFIRCNRSILEHRGDPELASEMVDVAQGYCPDFRKSGGNTMAFFDAAVRCHQTGEPCNVPMAN